MIGLSSFSKDRKISRWRRNDNSVPKPDIAGQWATILNKVLEIPCTINETRNVAEPKVLEMTEEAEVYFMIGITISLIMLIALMMMQMWRVAA